jgi:molybdopterin synthase catalytic subunit
MAEKELNFIIEEANEKWGPIKVYVAYRYGKLKIGEVIVLISVAAGHRDAAFVAARYIIDELKVRVPIWKADVFGDNVSWINGEKE